MPKLLFLVTEDWYFCSHRLPIAVEARRRGYDVAVVTRVNGHGEAIRSEGLRLIPLDMRRGAVNLLCEASVISRLLVLYRREKPDIVHHVAMKPVLYGSIVAWLSGVPHVVNALGGMGFIFTSGGQKARVLRSAVRAMFRILLNNSRSRLILQNSDDQRMFIATGLVSSGRISLIRGSGVDTTAFAPSPDPPGVPLVVLPARMLRDKGVFEFVAAAQELKATGAKARFALVGDTDPANPSAIAREQLMEWDRAKVVEWWGKREDMPRVLSECHVVCLPSYREGLPKALLEAASCGRPIVATDTNGCREIVRDGENGLLVPVRNSRELARALGRLINDAPLRREMGYRGRRIVESEFSVESVVEETIQVYEEMLRA